MATASNEVRFDIDERTKRLSCRETLTLGSVCSFTLYRGGKQVERNGWFIFRLVKQLLPASPEDMRGLGACDYEAGVAQNCAVLKEWWLVNCLRKLPVGVVVQIAVTAVDDEEGVVGEGYVDVLIATVAEVTEPKTYDPNERAALFRGERGAPGVVVVPNEGALEDVEDETKVAVSQEGFGDVIREVPPCSGETYKGKVLLANGDKEGSYYWGDIPEQTAVVPPLGQIPGKIKIVGSEGNWRLVQSAYTWNADAGRFEDSGGEIASIPMVDHVGDHTDGLL